MDKLKSFYKITDLEGNFIMNVGLYKAFKYYDKNKNKVFRRKLNITKCKWVTHWLEIDLEKLYPKQYK